MKPKLIAQDSDSIVIQTQAIPKKETLLGIPADRGFIYELGSAFRYPEQALLSILSHGAWDSTIVSFSDEELEAIVNLPLTK